MILSSRGINMDIGTYDEVPKPKIKERCESYKNNIGVRCRLSKGHEGKHKYWSSLGGYRTSWL